MVRILYPSWTLVDANSFTLCSLDVTLQTCVVHWLTVDPLEVEPAPRAMVSSAPSHGSVHELMPV